MATFTAGVSSLGLGNLNADPTAVKREVALLLGEDPKEDSVSLSQDFGGSGINPQFSVQVSGGAYGPGVEQLTASSTESVSVVSTYKVSTWGDSGGGMATWSGISDGNGQAAVDLGKYTLQFDKSNSAITVTEKATGDITIINGDPHVSDESGQTFTFKNNTTFQLSDGTDMTIKTVPAGNGATLSDEVDLSKGSLSMTVTGLASDDANPLTIAAGVNGRQLSAANASDPTIYEAGGNWVTATGVDVDQNYANQNL